MTGFKNCCWNSLFNMEGFEGDIQAGAPKYGDCPVRK